MHSVVSELTREETPTFNMVKAADGLVQTESDGIKFDGANTVRHYTKGSSPQALQCPEITRTNHPFCCLR